VRAVLSQSTHECRPTIRPGSLWTPISMSARRKYPSLPSLSPEQKKNLRKKLRTRTIVDSETGCRIWEGAVATQSRYGIIGDPRTGCKRPSYTHHLAAEIAGKVQPNVYPFDGSHEWQLHHVCRRRLCTNPDHLVWLTSKQHSAEHAPDRAEAAARRRVAKAAAVPRKGPRPVPPAACAAPAMEVA
jgi:hypothetical protein